MEPVEVFSGVIRTGAVLAPVIPARTVLHLSNVALATPVGEASVGIYYTTETSAQAILVCTLGSACRQYSTDLVFPAASNVRFSVRTRPANSTLAECEVHLSGFVEVVALPEDDEDEEDDEGLDAEDEGEDDSDGEGVPMGPSAGDSDVDEEDEESGDSDDDMVDFGRAGAGSHRAPSKVSRFAVSEAPQAKKRALGKKASPSPAAAPPASKRAWMPKVVKRK